MKPFVFSADSHIMEPPSIFLDGLPASLKRHAIHSRKEGDFLITGTEDKIIYRLRVGQHRVSEPDDLVDRLALRAEREQESAQLRGGRAARHHLPHRPRCL